MFSDNVVRRLSSYRRLLRVLASRGTRHVYSHELAALARVTAAQVRRDVMGLNISGNPARGYDVEALSESIGAAIDNPEGEEVALVGIGKLGRAILAYFEGRRPKLSIVAAFDTDPEKVNRVIHGCRCYPLDQLENELRRQNIRCAVVTVPVDDAQPIATRLVQAGVKGILNFAPRPLVVPENVYVESMDVTTALEKVAYFGRQLQSERKGRE